jgi:hypothetical protein
MEPVEPCNLGDDLHVSRSEVLQVSVCRSLDHPCGFFGFPRLPSDWLDAGCGLAVRGGLAAAEQCFRPACLANVRTTLNPRINSHCIYSAAASHQKENLLANEPLVALVAEG